MSPAQVEGRWGRRAAAWTDLALAVGLPVSTQVAAWTGRGRPETEQARESEGPLTPASGAFVIWGPIFASLAAYGVQRVRAPNALEDRGAETLARTSLIGNIAWSLNAQFKDLGWQSVTLIGLSAAAATASVARFARSEASNEANWRASPFLAPLAGWLSVAAYANLEATQRLTNSPSQSVLTPLALLVLASASTLAGLAVTRGAPLYAAAAGWGLAGIALKNARARPKLAAGALAGAVALAATTLLAAERTRVARTA